jgi:hypothetical protein
MEMLLEQTFREQKTHSVSFSGMCLITTYLKTNQLSYLNFFVAIRSDLMLVCK